MLKIGALYILGRGASITGLGVNFYANCFGLLMNQRHIARLCMSLRSQCGG